jgi:hypothetical protein
VQLEQAWWRESSSGADHPLALCPALHVVPRAVVIHEERLDHRATPGAPAETGGHGVSVAADPEVVGPSGQDRDAQNGRRRRA